MNQNLLHHLHQSLNKLGIYSLYPDDALKFMMGGWVLISRDISGPTHDHYGGIFFWIAPQDTKASEAFDFLHRPTTSN